MKDNDEFKNMTDEEKLHAENELLKLKLQAEFGMENMDSSLNSGMENEWLKNIYNFEKQYSENKRIKIFDFIGRPAFRKVEDMNKKEISQELQRITELMQSNGIELGIICNYDDEVIYNFITKELFEKETDDIRIPGMMNCFTYEDFYPNHDYDIREHANEFIKFLIEKKWDEFMNNTLLASSITYNDNKYEQKLFSEIIFSFQNENKKMKLLQWEIQSVTFDLEAGAGFLNGFIKYKSINSKQIFQGNVESKLKLEYDFWSISKVVLP